MEFWFLRGDCGNHLNTYVCAQDDREMGMRKEHEQVSVLGKNPKLFSQWIWPVI
jgi:hypothetical protein